MHYNRESGLSISAHFGDAQRATYWTSDCFFLKKKNQDTSLKPIRIQGPELGVPTHNREAWPYGDFCLQEFVPYKLPTAACNSIARF